MENSYKYFCNTECQFYPCHKIPQDGNFNCLFCYCPFYRLGKDCGGDFRYVGDNIKDCSMCNYPHQASNYDEIVNRIAMMNSNHLGIHKGFIFKGSEKYITSTKKRYMPVMDENEGS